MLTLIKMKYKEWKLKLTFYSILEAVIDERENIIKTVTNIYESLRDSAGEEFQDKLIAAIAELAHTQALKERESEKDKAV